MAPKTNKAPQRLFNFVIPFDKFQKLQKLSDINNCSVASIVRSGIDLILKKSKNDRIIS